MSLATDKHEVYEFWNKAACGEELYLKSSKLEDFNHHSAIRYQLEPYILSFADFDSAKGKKVLEIGVGLGADHENFAKAGALLHGVDLTERAVALTKQRLKLQNLTSKLRQGDAENLSFPNDTFDIVYSWGVLHHSPHTEKAISEVLRVLKPNGVAKIMIYHKYSMIGFMLWSRYALLKGKPYLSLDYIYSHYLESPGTKAYSIKKAKDLFSGFRTINIKTVLTHGDLLSSNVGQSHRGFFLTLARFIWPRQLVKTFFKKNGLFMLIEALK